MFQLDNKSRQPIYEQIINQVERHILAGLIKDKLPSVRSLSVSLRVNVNTVQRAYTELERAGIVITAPGRGAFVSETAVNLIKERKFATSLSEFAVLLRELRCCGTTKTELIALIEKIFNEEENNL